jgi:hypothetical protein
VNFSTTLRLWLPLACLFACAAPAAEPPPMIGFLQAEAERYEAEWRLYTGYYKTLAKNGLQGALTDSRSLYRYAPAAGKFYEQLKAFHAVVLVALEEGACTRMTDAHRQHCLAARSDLERYVREGGGLFLLMQAVRYPGDEDEKFYNLLLENFGCRLLHEGVFDKANTFVAPRTLVFPPMEFFVTANIKPHPATEGVRQLYLPRYACQPNPGVEALALDANWQTVVAGEPTAKSYFVGHENELNLDREASQKSAPPIAAVRSFGKGRVFIYSAPKKHVFLNHGNRQWPQITESDGDKENSKPSDSNKLVINALRWIAEPARQTEGFGAHKLAPIQPVKFEASVNWDAPFGKGRDGVRGIVGAHTSLSDGRGAVADYAKTARAAGLAFVVFTDPLELLTAEKLAKLKNDCAAASNDDFYACPGVEFTDNLGVRWVTWGEGVVWPEESFESNGRRYPCWDGKRILARGRYETSCRFAPNGIIDYRELRAANAHPANLWWFYRIFPFAYDGGKLIADNVGEYFYSLRDLRWMSVDAFTRIRSPEEVAAAARTCVSVVNNLKAGRELLNSRCGSYHLSLAAAHYVTQGPKILQWECCNSQMENPWQKTRGAQRVRLKFEVASDDGIAEVKVHDADYGIVRRYAGGGAATLAREFEMVQDKQHWLALEVADTKGRRAISRNYLVYSYKSGLHRCGDNLNILGSAQLCWHPDRNEMPSLAKIFENGCACTVQGIDSASGVASQPKLFAEDRLRTTEGDYPRSRESVVNKILDVPLGSHNLQIYSATMTHLGESYDTATRPTPSMGAVSRRTEPHEFFERRHTSYALQSRQDYFVTWNYRRPFEGGRDYRGSVIWHEGEIRWKKDATLAGDVPVPLLLTEGPGGAEFRTYDQFCVTDRDAGTLTVRLEARREKPYRRAGIIRPGGYCATMNTDLGYLGFLSSFKSAFSYLVSTHPQTKSLVGRTYIGLGRDKQQVKAGEVWPYRFAMATLPDQRLSNELLEDMARGYNLNGGTNGYPFAVKTGKFAGAEFFFTVEADGNEAAFTIGPRNFICDLPFRVRGVEDNGCAAIYIASRKFFRFVSVVDGTAYFQEPILPAATMWAGNPFVCEDKSAKLTLVVDGQSPGKAPLLEVHNPTGRELATRITSPPHTPQFGGLRAAVKLPAGDSVFFRIVGKELKQETQTP